MRGPGYKVSGDVRRTWRCSKCGLERKMSGDVTSLACPCQEGQMMQIVAERINVPRPIQRPSDVERRPIDFGIEPAPVAPPKVDESIIKPAISKEPDPSPIALENSVPDEPAKDSTASPDMEPGDAAEEWGDGIL